MSVLCYRESPGKFDSRTLSRETLSRWTGRNYYFDLPDGGVLVQGARREAVLYIYIYIYACVYIHIYIYIYVYAYV